MSEDALPSVPEELRPNYRAWAIYPKWQIDEGAALSLGVDPAALRRHRMDMIANDRPVFPRKLEALGIALEERRRLFGRVEDLRQIGGASPAEWMEVMRSLGLTAPGELVSAVDAVAPRVDWRRRAAELDARVKELETLVERLRVELHSAELPERERTSLLKLVIGMAVAGYSYDPRATRSATTTEIVGDLQRHGVALDADTVRKYLHEARNHLPPPEAE